jgi:hypothetical protein
MKTYESLKKIIVMISDPIENLSYLELYFTVALTGYLE